MYDLLRGRNDGLKKDAVRFAQKLVQTPSFSLNEDPVAAQVEIEMRRVGYDRVFRDEAGNVVGIMHGRDPDQTLLLNCHLDTVAPSKEAPWKESPWSGSIVGDQLQGLGAADCKGGLAAQVYAGLLLKRALLPLRGNLAVSATVAQENGGSAGLRYLLDHTLPELNLKPTFAVLGEPTNLGLHYGHEGWFEFDIRVEGTHADHARRAANVIYDRFGTDSTLWHNGDQLQASTIDPPRFTEQTDNPKAAVIRMARRLTSDDNVDGILTQVKHTATLAANTLEPVAIDVSVREEIRRLYTGTQTAVRHVTSAWETNPFHPLLARARESLMAGGCEAKPGRWRLRRLGMGTCGSVLVNDFQVPTIGYGPGAEEVAHAANEYVSISNIAEAVYGTALIAYSLVGVPVYGWTSDGDN